MTGYYTGGFKMAWDWLKVIIPFLGDDLNFVYDYQGTFTRNNLSFT